MFNYDNIGGKIKGFAKAIFIIYTVLTLLIGAAILITADEDRAIGIFMILFGPLCSWLGSLVLYGFGEIIDILYDISHSTNGAYRTAQKNDRRVTCRHCGTEAVYGTKFCAQCGSSFYQQQATTNREKENREREEILREMKMANAQMNAEPPKNLPTVSINRFGDGMCPICNKGVSFEGNVGNAKCPHCQSELKIQKNL